MASDNQGLETTNPVYVEFSVNKHVDSTEEKRYDRGVPFSKCPPTAIQPVPLLSLPTTNDFFAGINELPQQINYMAGQLQDFCCFFIRYELSKVTGRDD